MAEHPGNTLIQTAEIGKSLATSITTFITYRKVQDHRFENLYATLSITAEKLAELGRTLNEHQHNFSLKEEMTKPIQETCKSNFEKLLVMVNEGISGGVWKNDGTIGGQAVTAEVDPWFLMTMALGGPVDAKTFWTCLDDSRDSVLELNDLVKYMILKGLNERNCLNHEQNTEFQNLSAILPHLIKRLEVTKKAAEAKINETSERPVLNRINSDTNSDITLAAHPRRNQRAPIKEVDFDARSIRSMSTYNSFDSRGELPSDEVYEEWILRWNEPIKNVNRSWSFLGLKFKSYWEDRGFWGTDPELRTVDEMKEQEKLASAGLSPVQHKEAMQKAVRAIPKNGGNHIDFLLEERTESSNTEHAKREWSVVAVRSKAKFQYSSTKKWGKDINATEWLVTIKGKTVDTQERSRSYRRDDPWNSRHRNTRRYYSPERPRYLRPEIIRVRSRSPSPRRPMRTYRSPVISPPEPWDFPGRRGIPEVGHRNGTVAVSKILSKPDAEKRVQEIWDDMISKPTVEEST